MSNLHISYYIEEYRDRVRKSFYDFLENADINEIPYNDLSEMAEIYENNLRIDTRTSKKYTKLISMNGRFTCISVHSFILNRDDAKFNKGDILYPFRHNEPKYNRNYGNVFLKNYNPYWCKPLPHENIVFDNVNQV